MKDVTPLLMHWSYIFLVLTHRYKSYRCCSSLPQVIWGWTYPSAHQLRQVKLPGQVSGFQQFILLNSIQAVLRNIKLYQLGNWKILDMSSPVFATCLLISTHPLLAPTLTYHQFIHMTFQHAISNKMKWNTLLLIEHFIILEWKNICPGPNELTYFVRSDIIVQILLDA